ncbi:MAG: maleylacetoacetate isomerase [Lentisphaeraceae bacterium]|nr:maleylacetoacetate isomerase [Lentisphaeraceae bacterium]
MKLYDYYRSSASYRLRIALNYKKIDCELEHINLIDAAHHGESFKNINRQELVPVLQDGDLKLNQSLAILEYLEEKYPQKPLLPDNILKRAKIRAFALEIACEVHPLNNLRVLKYIKGPMQQSDEAKLEWYFHWLRLGFSSLDEKINTDTSFCFGNEPTWADIFLIPQIYNALRFKYPMDRHLKLLSVYEHCLGLRYFINASPEVRIQSVTDK